MKTLTKSLLVLTLAGFTLGFLFVTGVISVGDAVGWYMALPLGAIFFGLFLIRLMLEKEVALFDAEHQSHPATPPPDPSPAAELHPGYSAKPAH